MGKLEGKVALITGAGRGQGRSHALRLAEEGVDIIAVDIASQLPSIRYPMATSSDLAETATLVEALGRRAVPVEADVRDAPNLRTAVQAGVDVFGRLDVVVANAGVVLHASVLEMTDEMWNEVVGVNLTGAWNTISACLPHIVNGHVGGSVIIIGSTAGLRPGASNVAYAASKAAMISVMKSVALELAPHGIRVNTVAPGAVNTPMIRNDSMKKRFLPEKPDATDADVEQALTTKHPIPVPWVDPVDVSNAVVYFASDETRYITGNILTVDAGTLLK
jgi:(+)-trans-carveol dehydrogenase